MNTHSIIVSGHSLFLRRYADFIDSLSNYFGDVRPLPSGNWVDIPTRIAGKLTHGTPLEKFLKHHLSTYDKRPMTFVQRSRQTEKKIVALAAKPDFVIHLFCLFGPFWNDLKIPYAMYLDYTMALARKEWPSWSPYRREAEFRAWFDNEQRTYRNAKVIFTMGSHCKDSLVNDYKIPEGKIRVVGSGADFRHPYDGPKTFGTKQILFQGSEFERKGGDLLLEALKLIRMAIPEATLVIIGSDRMIVQPGVTSLGYVSEREQLQRLFLSSDLVIAPARCDPFTAFVIEAMNYQVPTIVTKCSGISEVIDNGENGVVIDSLNPTDIAAQAIRLLSSPAALDRISNGGKRLVREQLNWDSIAARVSSCIQEILADRA